MDDTVWLKKSDLVFERSFTHPEHISPDKACLQLMIDELCSAILAARDAAIEPIWSFSPSEEQWHKRMIVPRPMMMNRKELTIVGFFGQRRQPVCPTIKWKIWDVGRRLIEQFDHFPAVFAYLTWLLVDEINYANLVVLDGQQAIKQWRNTPPHPYVTDMLAPAFYTYVRIYNGTAIAGHPEHTHTIHLHQVKYWDYQVKPTWHAVRDLL